MSAAATKMASRATNLSVTSVAAGALILVGSMVWFGVGSSAAPPVSAVPASPTAAVDGRIAVHISGAVVMPGVVRADPDARVADIVRIAGGATPLADLGGMNLAAPVRDGDHIVVPELGTRSGPGDAGQPFNINTADAAAFEALPGVGPVLAERIVAFRDANGPFEAIEDLLDVPGIGEAKLSAIRTALGE